MSVDATRLLVLGATRQEQPATGYAIMRELTSWGVQEWASVNPGSIYGALRALVKDAFLVEDTDPASTTGRSHKTSTKFRVTPAGEVAFIDLLRSALREVDTYRVAPFQAALCFFVELPRKEVAGAIDERVIELERRLAELKKEEALIPASETKPMHSVEFTKLATARLDGELSFTRTLIRGIRTGTYTFAGE
jgi:DNA-binding PadR family transcriptional regulator